MAPSLELTVNSGRQTSEHYPVVQCSWQGLALAGQPAPMVLRKGWFCHPAEQLEMDKGTLVIPSDWTSNG